MMDLSVLGSQPLQLGNQVLQPQGVHVTPVNHLDCWTWQGPTSTLGVSERPDDLVEADLTRPSDGIDARVLGAALGIETEPVDSRLETRDRVPLLRAWFRIEGS